jgi:hypothetical protein
MDCNEVCTKLAGQVRHQMGVQVSHQTAVQMNSRVTLSPILHSTPRGKQNSALHHHTYIIAACISFLKGEHKTRQATAQTPFTLSQTWHNRNRHQNCPVPRPAPSSASSTSCQSCPSASRRFFPFTDRSRLSYPLTPADDLQTQSLPPSKCYLVHVQFTSFLEHI